MRVTATVSGDLRKIVEEEGRLAAGAIRRGVDAAGREVQEELRGQARAAFRGNSIANAWRMRVYPRGGAVTLHPAAVVYSGAPDIVDSAEKGVPITVGRGKAKYLCWPTGYNATRGRRGAGRRGGVRVTPEEMVASKGQAVVIPVKSRAGLFLWCLRVREGRGLSRRSRNRVRLYVGSRNVEVATGKGRAGERAKRIQGLLERGYVALFFLSKQITPRKRLDVKGVADRAGGVLKARVTGALRS